MSKVKFELPKDLFLKKKKKQNKIMNAFSKKTCKQLKKIFSVQFVFQPKIKKKTEFPKELPKIRVQMDFSNCRNTY